MSSATVTDGGERGFIIVAVLWIMAAISALVLIYSAYVSSTAVAIGDSTARVQDQAVLTGAVELACYQLLTANETGRSGSGNFNGRIGAARISVAYVSEAARLDLNMASGEVLKGLLLGLGETDRSAEDLATRIVAWRTPPSMSAGSTDNAEDVLYRSSGYTYLPRHGPFPSAEELRLVYGIPKHVASRMLAFVTVFSGRSSINILEAAPQVVAALPRMTAERLQTILTARADQVAPRELLALAGAGPDVVTAEPSKTTRLAIGIDYPGGRRMNSEVVVLLANDGIEPCRLLSRQDNIPTATNSAVQQKDSN